MLNQNIYAPVNFFKPSVDIDFGLSSGRPIARLHTSDEHTPKTIAENVKLLNQRIYIDGYSTSTVTILIIELSALHLPRARLIPNKTV